VNAQEGVGEDKKKVNRDTSVFQIGGIVAKDCAIASIERASTSTEVTDKAKRPLWIKLLINHCI
jgi:hypothetical protein